MIQSRAEYQRKWRAANIERARAYSRDWHAVNAEKVAASRKRWRAANPDKVREQSRRKYAKLSPESKLKMHREQYARHMSKIAPEKVAEQYLRETVEARGGMCPKFIDPARNGAPDRMVLLPGHPVYFVEMKRAKLGKLRPWQQRYHDDLRALGHEVRVLWSKEDVDEFFAGI